MEAPNLERKLVAILAADFEGFSRHMERDEAITLATLSSHRSVIDASIAEHGGRITGTAGDSVLAEFASVVSAVNCAVQIQQVLAGANGELDPERRLMLRIGINVGDVMVKDGDIFGDGVNIAARLESLADPGGICVSRGVRDHLRKHRIVVFEDLGEQKVKNISQPIRAFKVRVGETPPEEAAAEVLDESHEPLDPPPPTPSLADEVKVELAFWDSIKDSENAAEFEAYLDRFPEGSFAALAATRADALRASSREKPADSVVPDENAFAVELAFWQAAEGSGNHLELEAYLERYPDGQFAPLAQARIESMREAESHLGDVRPEDAVEMELVFWNTIKDSGNPAMFRAYLHKYPNGAFSEIAEISIAGRSA